MYIKHLCISKSFTQYCGAPWFKSWHAINHSINKLLSASGSPAWPDPVDKLGAKMGQAISRPSAVIFLERRHARGPLFQPLIPNNSTYLHICKFLPCSFGWVEATYATLPKRGVQARHSESKSWLSHVFTSLGSTRNQEIHPYVSLDASSLSVFKDLEKQTNCDKTIEIVKKSLSCWLPKLKPTQLKLVENKWKQAYLIPNGMLLELLMSLVHIRQCTLRTHPENGRYVKTTWTIE